MPSSHAIVVFPGALGARTEGRVPTGAGRGTLKGALNGFGFMLQSVVAAGGGRETVLDARQPGKGVPMKRIVLACAASLAMFAAASAEGLPTLSEFLSSCYRDNGACQQKIKDYVAASKAQKIICVAEDVSIRQAAMDTLRWLRSSENVSEALNQQPYDEGLYEATTKLFPCKTDETPQPPVPPPAEPPAADPAAAP
jgi:hypothetical protein